MLQKKGVKLSIGIIAGIIIGIITVFAIIYIFLLKFFFGGPVKKIEGVDKYEETILKYTSGDSINHVHTGFITFPESIPESAFESGSEPEFYFEYRDTWDVPTCEVYLKCQYNDSDYVSELSRLESTVKSFKGYKNTNSLIYDDSGRFSHPVYIAIDHHSYSYEYAMDLGNNSIVYIYTSWKKALDDIKKIPTEYLPKDFEDSMTADKAAFFAEGNYDIYEAPNPSGPQHTGAVDYTR